MSRDPVYTERDVALHSKYLVDYECGSKGEETSGRWEQSYSERSSKVYFCRVIMRPSGSFKISSPKKIMWENPLIGWTSTGDPLSSIGEAGLSFDIVDATKTYAEKHGWEYAV